MNSPSEAEKIWNQKHPNGKLLVSHDEGIGDEKPTRLKHGLNKIKMLKISTLTKMILSRHDLHQ